MKRVLAGVASAVLVAAAGIFWWQGRDTEAPPVPMAPVAQAAPMPLLGDAPPEPPAAAPGTREEKRFNRYDKDRDERITPEEYFASRRKAFARLDANGDGRLSFDEWTVKTREKFGKADADRSTALSRAEFATTAPVRKAKPTPECPPERRPATEEEG